MAEESLFKRLLRRRTGPKEEKLGEKTVSSEPAKPAPVEKILGVPLSRRRVLGGAATTAASMTGKSTMPQTPVIVQQGVPEAAAILGSKVAALRRVTYALREPIASDAFEIGARVLTEGDHVYVPFLEPVRKIRELVNNLPPSLTLDQLKEPGIIDKALELSGQKEYISDSTFNIAKRAERSFGELQKITGLTGTATVGEIQETLRKKTLQMIKKVAYSRDMPPPGSRGRQAIFEALRDELKRVDPRQSDSDLAEYIDEVNEEEKALVNARARSRIARESSDRQAHADVLERKRQRQNIELSERDNIFCSVDTSVKEPRDPADARVFVLTPLRANSRQQINLTRMHIQHLRQFLTEMEIIDDYSPATTRIEEVGNSIRVSTTDKKFQEHLMSFVGSRKALVIPNRLQIIIPAGNEER